VSFAATLALYELAVRRFRPARLLLGMKPPPAPLQVNDPLRARTVFPGACGPWSRTDGPTPEGALSPRTNLTTVRARRCR
jgi:hypothetical protein